MIGVNWEHSAALRRRVSIGVVIATIVVSAVVAGLSSARPAAAAPDGTWDWNVSTDPEDIAQAGQSSGVSSDGQVIATIVDASAAGQSGTATALWHIRVSRDGGETWSSTPLLPGQIPSRVSVSPDGARVGVRGAWYNTQANPWLLLSANSGVSFSTTVGALPFATIPTSLVVRNNVIFASDLSGQLVGGVYVYSSNVYASADNGATWTLRSTVNNASAYITGLSASSNGQRVVMAGDDGGIFVSSDGAATWTTIPLSSIAPDMTTAGLSALPYSLAVSDDGQRLNASMYAYDSTGVFTEAAIYTSTDAGATWQKHENRFSVTITGAVSTSFDGRTILALDMSNYDGGTGIGTMSWIITRDGGATWEPLDTYADFTGAFATLSGDGRTIFFSDNNGEAGALRLIAGRWTPVPVVDPGTDTPVSGPALGAPDTGVAPGGLGSTPLFAGGLAVVLIASLWALWTRPSRTRTAARVLARRSVSGRK